MPTDFEATLRVFLERPKWDDEKQLLKHNLLVVAKAERLFVFKTRSQYFNLQRLPHIGETAVYDVPPSHRGALKEFRSLRVKVVCIANDGSNDRIAVAYPIEDNATLTNS